MSKPFGYSYLLDMYDVKPEYCDDLERHYRFLEGLVVLLDMTKMSAPVVMHGPRDSDNKELFPDKAGVSGWVPLIESGIQIHSCAPTKFITLDVYSCKQFDAAKVLAYASAWWGFGKNYDHVFLPRGCRFGLELRDRYIKGE